MKSACVHHEISLYWSIVSFLFISPCHHTIALLRNWFDKFLYILLLCDNISRPVCFSCASFFTNLLNQPNTPSFPSCFYHLGCSGSYRMKNFWMALYSRKGEHNGCMFCKGSHQIGAFLHHGAHCAEVVRNRWNTCWFIAILQRNQGWDGVDSRMGR